MPPSDVLQEHAPQGATGDRARPAERVNPRYLMITPVRDEAAHIERTIASVIAQTITPSVWVTVDDGSSDGTGDILASYASRFDWMRVVRRQDRGCRAAGSGVVEAFYAGYSELSGVHFDFLVKLDGDLSFAADYFERSFAHFARDQQLGIGGGTVCHWQDGAPETRGDPAFHVRGATKIYRRACWETIAPLPCAPGWDTIDEVKANLHGWTTRTFSDLKVLQHKRTGSADGDWNNWFKNGRANYVAGYHPLFMLAKCCRRAFASQPPFAESLALMLGFSTGYLKRLPRGVDEATIAYLRGQQLRRLLHRSSIYR